ncbi:nucleotidyltransferase-like protein [Metabacillus arenae]|uniref:Nucleotidyltransferase-like protein n=1 Tax=Metabacillus arenae TaxID=2771434 RepID=A0A926NEC0_9BACI|nr:nucleotidyltransferase-like protein [Metabacillus arenae]MBD1379676.1 hypothetical protein [Metabacillus arenae]
MENILRPIYQERASHPDTLAVLMMEKRNQTSPQTDNLDVALFVIVKDAEHPLYVKHYEFNDQKASLNIVTSEQVDEWLLLGTNRRMVDLIFNSKVLFDRNEFLLGLRDRLSTFPFGERKLKIGLEFGKLIRRYLEGKAFFESKQFLDAYNSIVHALHHLARLEVIDKGFYPEVTVWNQVKQIEPQVYKLYQELVESDETLEKRLELLFLASDFLIHSKTEIGVSHLLKVMKGKDSWLFAELLLHPELKYYSVDLSVILEFLVEREIIKVKRIETKGQDVYHRAYSIS